MATVLVEFSQTRVTDAALEHVKGLTSLESLSLQGTQVTDDGLEHVKGLDQVSGRGPQGECGPGGAGAEVEPETLENR